MEEIRKFGEGMREEKKAAAAEDTSVQKDKEQETADQIKELTNKLLHGQIKVTIKPYSCILCFNDCSLIMYFDNRNKILISLL